MKLALVLLVVACSKATPAGPCERGARLEMREVDNDAPYMHALFAHVGFEGREGLPTDPRAIELGVRAEVDQWRREVGEDEVPGIRPNPTQIDYYLVAPDKHALETYLTGWEKPPSDRELVMEAGPRYSRTYYVFKKPVLDTRAIADVSTVDDPYMKRPIIAVDLTTEGREAFRAATARIGNGGKKLATLVDGQVMSAPIVNGEIAGGRFTITIPTITTPEIVELGKKLACVTSRAP